MILSMSLLYSLLQVYGVYENVIKSFLSHVVLLADQRKYMQE